MWDFLGVFFGGFWSLVWNFNGENLLECRRHRQVEVEKSSISNVHRIHFANPLVITVPDLLHCQNRKKDRLKLWKTKELDHRHPLVTDEEDLKKVRYVFFCQNSKTDENSKEKVKFFHYNLKKNNSKYSLYFTKFVNFYKVVKRYLVVYLI